jgi:uncharacterized protein
MYVVIQWTPLFVLHIFQNPLETLQAMTFKDALDHVHNLESVMTPSERVLAMVNVDPRIRAHEAIVNLSSVFLDRGAAKWSPSFRNKGFLYFFANLEHLGFAAWRSQARKTATLVLRDLKEHPENSSSIAAAIIQDTLNAFGVTSAERTNVLRVMALELRGWAGMFRRMETHVDECPVDASVRLMDFMAVHCILTRSSIEEIARQTGWSHKETSLAEWMSKTPNTGKPVPHSAMHTSSIAFVDQISEHRERKELEFEQILMRAIGTQPISTSVQERPSMQLYTCIDDREGSFRRHVEAADPHSIETFGVPGFFGVPIQYKPADGGDVSILAPEGQHPSAVLVEKKCSKHETYDWRRQTLAHVSRLWESASFSPLGSLALAGLFPVSIARLYLMGFAPGLNRNLKESFLESVLQQPLTDFRSPYEPKEGAALLANTFLNVGTQKRFAPFVIVLGHGAMSVNNPYAAAYNCGACGGREGAPNARLLARLANNPDVRSFLALDHDILIPEDTVFVGGMHNTTDDSVHYFDLDVLPMSRWYQFQNARAIIEKARGQNALERCSKFLLAQDVHCPEAALRHVQTRATDAAEIRPELNHATNLAVVIGRRELTKGRNLDRRAFLPSYDPLSDDDRGTNLENVLAPALVVCSGINLEYLFSTIEADHHGAGTKAPLNVVGNIGVMQGTTGDLRPGLPSQMTVCVCTGCSCYHEYVNTDSFI